MFVLPGLNIAAHQAAMKAMADMDIENAGGTDSYCK
jgi:hypothetical protein